jgi:hypothetical protein
MGHPLAMSRPRAAILALETNAQRAGAALACAYSNSEEFEAAVIDARRKAGAFRRSPFRSPALWSALAVVLTAAWMML